MFFYELALELGEKSGDLAELAAAAGIPGLTAPTEITREQADQIRQAKWAASGGRPSPAGGPPPPRPDGPLAWTDPGSAPPPSPPPPPSASPLGALGAAGVPGAPPAPPPGMPTFQAPPPVAAGAGGLAPGAAWTGMAPPEPKAGRSHLIVVGGVIALVVALFGYMALHTGDPSRAKRLAAANARADAEPDPTVDPRLATTTTTTEVPTTAAPPLVTTTTLSDQWTDLATYCSGARATAGFELRMVAGEIEQDWQNVQRDVVDGKVAWEAGVNEMVAGASPVLRPDVVLYHTTYEGLIAKVAAGHSAQDLLAAVQGAVTSDLLAAAGRINSATRNSC